MKIFFLPPKIKVLIFDIDSTLYTNEDYAFEQVDVQIREFAKENALSAEEARTKIKAFRANFSQKHNGATISLGNTLTHFGIPIEKSINWRNTLLEPSRFLSSDSKLAKTLELLSEKYTLIAVTNNPVLPARKTLQALGVEKFFIDIIGLDTSGVSKPHEKPFLLACENVFKNQQATSIFIAQKEKNLKEVIATSVSIGDRFSIDLELPLKLGMGGILVAGVEDVYQLPTILEKH